MNKNGIHNMNKIILARLLFLFQIRFIILMFISSFTYKVFCEMVLALAL